jgi:hypothetical protein
MERAIRPEDWPAALHFRWMGFRAACACTIFTRADGRTTETRIMRTLFGIVLGIALAVGAAYVHDDSVPADPNPLIPERQIVNWDVLGQVVHEKTASIQGWFDRSTGRPGR